MDKETNTSFGRLFIDLPLDKFISVDTTNRISEETLTELTEKEIHYILCILDNEIDEHLYKDFAPLYTDAGFIIESINSDILKRQKFQYVQNALLKIKNHLKAGNVLIFSLNESEAAGMLTACLQILTGRSPEEAIEKTRKIRNAQLESEEAVTFVYEFSRFTNSEDETEYNNDTAPTADQEVHNSDNATYGETPGSSYVEKAKKTKLAQKLRDFRPTIQFKLISIISIIIIVTISVMIFMATYFFRADNEVRIIESNHKISELSALNAEINFSSITEKANLIAATMMQDFRSPGQKNTFVNLFFSNDKDFIFVGIAERSQNTFRMKRSIYNTDFMAKRNIPMKSIQRSIHEQKPMILRALNGESLVFNASGNFNLPVMGILTPLEKRNRTVRTILVIYIKLDRFLRAFRSSGIFETFMINDRGDVIAHTDENVILSQANYLDLPIVTMMKKSKVDNGQTRYEDRDGIVYMGSFKKIGFAGTGVVATVMEERAFEEVYNIQRRNLYILLISVNIAIFIIFFFGRTLTTPILRLVRATKEIEHGNFNINIVPTTRDEIGDLTSSFISMGRGLEEREKMKEAFGKFVNKEIAERVLKGEIKLGGERVEAAVFFSDIRSFTAISEKLEPEEVVEFLNQYMTRMVHCVNKTFGVVDKYIGDAIMAIWGAPVSKGNDTENAINAALMMRRELIEFNRDRGSDKRPIIRIGCGINTGPVLAGQIGSEDRMEYTVIGDTVNLASRIEALNKPFGTDILISADSCERLTDTYRVEPMRKIMVKGKEEPQQIFAVLGRLDDSDSPETIEQLRELLDTEYVISNENDKDLEEEVKYEIIDQ